MLLADLVAFLDAKKKAQAETIKLFVSPANLFVLFSVTGEKLVLILDSTMGLRAVRDYSTGAEHLKGLVRASVITTAEESALLSRLQAASLPPVSTSTDEGCCTLYEGETFGKRCLVGVLRGSDNRNIVSFSKRVMLVDLAEKTATGLIRKESVKKMQAQIASLHLPSERFYSETKRATLSNGWRGEAHFIHGILVAVETFLKEPEKPSRSD